MPDTCLVRFILQLSHGIVSSICGEIGWRGVAGVIVYKIEQNGDRIGKEEPTRIKCANKAMILKIITDSWEVNRDRYIERS